MTDTLTKREPAVSVVIPTRNRPALVRDAIVSVLEQTYSDLEIIVVIDGEDETTEAVTASISDARLKVQKNTQSVGGAEARNIGVRLSTAEWITFLDDDDQWLPQKLAAQMELAATMTGEHICIACKFIARSEQGDRILPLRVPENGEPISEYIYCPKGLSVAEGFIQTSTILVRRSLMLKVPFLSRLACGQETTWLLRAAKDEGVRLTILPEALVLFNDFASRSRISIAPRWRTLYNWARENRSYYTPKSYSFFVSTICIQYAKTCNEPVATYFDLFRECLKGRPTPKCIVLFLYRWWMPEKLRRGSGALVRNTLKVLRGEAA